MPIYEYRCGACGFEKEYLQKLSDAPVKVCERCGQASMAKLMSAAGFQLKGSGWYVTDFKNPGAKARPPEGEGKAEPDKKADAATKTESDKKSDTDKKEPASKASGSASADSAAPQASPGSTPGASAG